MVATPWLWALGAMTAGSNLSFLLWPPSLPGGAAAFWRGQRPRQNRPAAGRSPAAGGWAEPTRRPPVALRFLPSLQMKRPFFPSQNPAANLAGRSR